MWRLLRTDIKLNIYTLENCVAHVLQERTPHIGQQLLEAWWMEGVRGMCVLGGRDCLCVYVHGVYMVCE